MLARVSLPLTLDVNSPPHRSHAQNWRVSQKSSRAGGHGTAASSKERNEKQGDKS